MGVSRLDCPKAYLVREHVRSCAFHLFLFAYYFYTVTFEHRLYVFARFWFFYELSHHWYYQFIVRVIARNTLVVNLLRNILECTHFAPYLFRHE